MISGTYDRGACRRSSEGTMRPLVSRTPDSRKWMGWRRLTDPGTNGVRHWTACWQVCSRALNRDVGVFRSRARVRCLRRLVRCSCPHRCSDTCGTTRATASAAHLRRPVLRRELSVGRSLPEVHQPPVRNRALGAAGTSRRSNATTSRCRSCEQHRQRGP